MTDSEISICHCHPYSSGIITISPYARLDRDVTDNYALVVNAIDSGVPSETSTATVKVRITDVNNKSPRFVIFFDNNLAVRIL